MIRTTVIDGYGGVIRIAYTDGELAVLTLQNEPLFERYELDLFTLTEFIDMFQFVREHRGAPKTWKTIMDVRRVNKQEWCVEGNMCSIYLNDEMLDALIENLYNIKHWYEMHEVI